MKGIKTKLTFKQFAKKFGYLIVLGLLLVAIILTVTLANTNNGKTNTIIDSGANEPVSPVQSSSLVFVSPLDGASIYKNYSERTLAYNLTLKQWEAHKAVDFVSENSKDVKTIADGTIKNVYSSYSDGTVIVIEHAEGLKSVYKSLAANVSVAIGDKVSAGQVIGEVSTTSANELNDGAHLHLEVYKNDVVVNPLDYIDTAEK